MRDFHREFPGVLFLFSFHCLTFDTDCFRRRFIFRCFIETRLLEWKSRCILKSRRSKWTNPTLLLFPREIHRATRMLAYCSSISIHGLTSQRRNFSSQILFRVENCRKIACRNIEVLHRVAHRSEVSSIWIRTCE